MNIRYLIKWHNQWTVTVPLLWGRVPSCRQAGGSGGFASRPPAALPAARRRVGAAGRAWLSAVGATAGGGGGARGPALGATEPGPWHPQGTEQDPAWKYSPLRGCLCGRPRAAFPRQPAQKPRWKNLHQPCSCDGGDAAAPQRCQGDEKWVKTRLGEDGAGVCAGRQHCLWAEPRVGLCRC